MRVTVVGLGYVGSVATAALTHSGHNVLGVDIAEARVLSLREGKSAGYEPRLGELLKEGLEGGRLEFRCLEEVERDLGEVVVIAVGTPSLPTGGADLSQVRAAMRWVVAHASPRTTVVMKSTVPPGTGRRLASQEVKRHGLRYVANPEFLRQGQAVHDWLHPDRIIIGTEDPASTGQALALYRGIEAPVVVTDITTAEMIKYAANAFLATKIAFINEVANLSERLGASIDDVAQGIALDPRIGASYLRAGLGYGGSCFPKDVRALDFLSTAVGEPLELLRAVITVNNRQRYLPVEALHQAFGDLQGVPVAVLGLAFKPHTDDVREAPALDIISWLAEEGAQVRAYDPVAMPGARALLPSSVVFCREPLEALTGARAGILVTEWPELVELDWEAAARVMAPPRFIFDGRNALDPKRLGELGIRYYGVARGNHTTPTTQENRPG
jgi:UDPglucose 6-dehydrogenase